MTDSDSTPTILVADDEEDLRELVAYRLTRSGYNVIGAEDGRLYYRRDRPRVPDQGRP